MEVQFDQEKLEKAIVAQAVNELLGDNGDLFDRASHEISSRVDAALAKGLDGVIEKTINEIMEKALDTEIAPVNVWGEREGNATTIRAALHERARNFWSEKVDKEGKASSYGGQPRYEHVLSIITAKEFDSAIKQNITDIAGAMKDAIRKDFYEQVDGKLNEFFKVKSLFEQGKPRSAA